MEAWEDFLAERRTAEHLAALQHHGPETTPCQIGAADEAIVADSDDDGVIALGHEAGSLRWLGSRAW
jgi:hypothetical protein